MERPGLEPFAPDVDARWCCVWTFPLEISANRVGCEECREYIWDDVKDLQSPPGRFDHWSTNSVACPSTIRPGVIDIHDGGNVAHQVFVAGGFAEVLPNRCTVLAEQALMVESIDPEDVRPKIEAAELDLRDAETDADRSKAEEELAALRAMLDAAPGQ